MADTPNLTGIINGISRDRLQPYRLPGDTDEDALRRYEQNILLSEALYPSLHMLEVVLRNNIENVFIQAFGNSWYRSANLTRLMHRNNKPNTEHKQIRRAVKTLVRIGKPVTSGRVVAELNFGFWTGMFGRAYEQTLWIPYAQDLLPDAEPSDRDIKEIRVDLDTIRHLRNRVAHHEPIWNDPHLLNKHAAITRLLAWLNAAAQTYLVRCDRFAEVHGRLGLSVKD